MAGLEGVDAGGLILRDDCEDTSCWDLEGKKRAQIRIDEGGVGRRAYTITM